MIAMITDSLSIISNDNEYLVMIVVGWSNNVNNKSMN